MTPLSHFCFDGQIVAGLDQSESQSRSVLLSGMLEKQRPQFHVAPFVKNLQVGEIISDYCK